ncbi:HIT family protein [Bacillus sp. V2I10]|uniref:HIT family protein n=1 Tax=Bacillus sp. V2I10 TaxID=3042276 RepID=UPI002781C46B|nr:HIT family protein [Bacillus sp. V2I10]MDQ0857201.1 diadenosine tetraphosphate (Ap4A) HIT family hydrolase [Bacillus sp. V2I10]
MTSCPICQKHQDLNEAIYEDQDWIVTHGPVASQVLGYLYIEPKRHVENWSEFTDQELSAVGPLIKKLEAAVKKELSVDRMYVVTISEAVRHLHFHLIPRLHDQEIKGLPLIEQATQQKTKESHKMTEQNLNLFIKNVRSTLS